MAIDNFFDPQDLLRKERKQRVLSQLNSAQDQTPKREPFSLREGLDTFSKEGANAFKAPSDSPFLRSMAPQDRPKISIEQPKAQSRVSLDRAADAMLYGNGEKKVGGNWDQLNQQTNQITATSPNESTIGGMKSNLRPYDEQVKSSMDALNAKVASMPIEDLSLEQINKIQELRRRAGFMRGGTDRQRVGPDGLPIKNNIGNLDVTFDSSVDQNARQRFLENPIRPTAQINRYNDLYKDNNEISQGQLAAINADKVLGKNRTINNEYELFTKENSPGMGWQTRKELNQQIINNKQSNKNTLAEINAKQSNTLAEINANQNINRNKINVDRETNRINEMGVIAENKLRDIQGRVAQKLPKTEKRESKVINRYDPISGNIIGQDIVTANPDGTYPNINAQQFRTPKEATVEKMLKMRNSNDPNLAAAETEYINTFGKLPY